MKKTVPPSSKNKNQRRMNTMLFTEKNFLRVRLTFLDEVLGMMPAQEEIYSEFIASHAPDAMTREEEVEEFGVSEVERQGTTVFPRDEEGHPFFYDYQIRGMFKDSCGMLRRVKNTISSKTTAYKKVIDGEIFISDRKNPLIFDGKVTTCQRPLRASTAQGERIALASSEAVPAGATLEFEVKLLDPAHRDLVLEWLDYGEMRGMGQWRNSGKGRFKYEILED